MGFGVEGLEVEACGLGFEVEGVRVKQESGRAQSLGSGVGGLGFLDELGGGVEPAARPRRRGSSSANSPPPALAFGIRCLGLGA